MFWKKKRVKSDRVHHESTDSRQCFRYDFKPGRGLTLVFKEKSIHVLNISAGGIAFHNDDFQPLEFDSIKFVLNIPNFKGDASFSARLRILNIDAENVCHAIFEQCTLEQYELIHQYVLEMQKHDLAH